MKKLFIIFIILIATILIFYKNIFINLTIRKHIVNNNIEGYHIVNIERFPAMDGYLVRLENNFGEFRNLTIISTIMPLDVIYDSKIDKVKIKWKNFLRYYYFSNFVVLFLFF